jgi:hypothetical protein
MFGAKKEGEKEKTGENYVTRSSSLPNIRVTKSNGIKCTGTLSFVAFRYSA